MVFVCGGWELHYFPVGKCYGPKKGGGGGVGREKSFLFFKNTIISREGEKYSYTHNYRICWQGNIRGDPGLQGVLIPNGNFNGELVPIFTFSLTLPPPMVAKFIDFFQPIYDKKS